MLQISNISSSKCLPLKVLDISPCYHLPLLSALLVNIFPPLQGKFRTLKTMFILFISVQLICSPVSGKDFTFLFLSIWIALPNEVLYSRIEVYRNYSTNRNHEKKSLALAGVAQCVEQHSVHWKSRVWFSVRAHSQAADPSPSIFLYFFLTWMFLSLSPAALLSF